jgi:hypothetical protein
MYIISSNDGTTELDEVFQTALARLLINTSAKTNALVVTEVDLPPEEVSRNYEDGSINFHQTDFESHTMMYHLTPSMVKSVIVLGELAEHAMNVRDNLLRDLMSNLLKDGTNEVDFTRDSNAKSTAVTKLELDS